METRAFSSTIHHAYVAHIQEMSYFLTLGAWPPGVPPGWLDSQLVNEIGSYSVGILRQLSCPCAYL